MFYFLLFIIIVIFILIFVTIINITSITSWTGRSCSWNNGPGQPACKTDEELKVKLYRNNWDPSSFWQCETLNKPAEYKRCPDEFLYNSELKQCVVWSTWKWTEECDPPEKDNIIL